MLLLSTHQKEMKAGTQTDIYLSVQVAGSIIHSGQKVEATQVSVDGRWIEKLWAVHTSTMSVLQP